MPDLQAQPNCCPVCGNMNTVEVGPIFHAIPTEVAGVPIDINGIHFRLMRCPNCAFQFKSPSIDESVLLRCYEQASAAHWEDDPDPIKRQFDTLRNLVQTHSPGRRILDVGCFNGAILNFLGDSWQRFGVEPSAQAARRAAGREVTVLGRTIDDIDPAARRFDAILLIDVIEHLPDPLSVVRRAAACLQPRGIIVVGTGSTDAWSWRLQRNRYWYCSLPEHVSFFSRRTMEFIAGELPMDSVAHLRISHVRAHPIRRIRKSLPNLLFEAARRSRGFGIPPLNRWLQSRSAPGWLTARDHMLHVLRKRS